MEQLPFLTAIPLNLGSAAFAAWIGGLCAGVLLMIRGRKKGSELTRDLGIALFIGGFLGLSVNQLEFRESRRLVNDLRTDIVHTYFRGDIPKDVSDQIEENILRDPFYYVTCDVELTLSNPRDNVPPAGFLKMDIDAHFIVQNTTEEVKEYMLAVSLSDPHAPLPSGMKQIWVTSNVDPSKNFDLNEAQAKALLDLKPSANELVFERSFNMKPKEELDIHMRSYAYPEEKDMYILTPRHACHRLGMRVNLPDTNYTTACNFNHPGLDDVAQCICHNEQAGFAKAEINAAVLPYQGVMIEWEKKNAIKVP